MGQIICFRTRAVLHDDKQASTQAEVLERRFKALQDQNLQQVNNLMSYVDDLADSDLSLAQALIVIPHPDGDVLMRLDGEEVGLNEGRLLSKIGTKVQGEFVEHAQ